jgi:hypothetical protein
MTTYEAESKLTPHEHEFDTESDRPVTMGPVTVPGSAAFQAKYVGRDLAAGIITGAMAIPLSVGIAMMSEYPSKSGWRQWRLPT